jgi:hypothetical protein
LAAASAFGAGLAAVAGLGATDFVAAGFDAAVLAMAGFEAAAAFAGVGFPAAGVLAPVVAALLFEPRRIVVASGAGLLIGDASESIGSGFSDA